MPPRRGDPSRRWRGGGRPNLLHAIAATRRPRRRRRGGAGSRRRHRRDRFRPARASRRRATPAARAGDGKEHTFTSIDRNEYKGLLEFLTAKGLKIRNLVETAAAENEARKRAMGLDGSSSDDDMPQRGPADSNDEDSPDEDFVAPKDASDDDDDDDDDDEDGSGSDEEEEKPKKFAKLGPREGVF